MSAAAWLDKDRMVIPLGPAEGADKNRLVLYDRARVQKKTMEVDLQEIRDRALGLHVATV